MEKKSIGSFISALRKANGLTQKELAEKLNVSDKTVSRWETGESAPDLSLIPVIAEIFGVTCDELLCGERKAPNAVQEDNTAQAQKADKQRRMMLRSALSKYRGQTYISMLVAAVGFITALICNFAFLKGVLGFLGGMLILVIAVVWQAYTINRALFVIDDDEQFEARQLSDFKRSIIKFAELLYGVVCTMLGFIFPMVLVDTYAGITADSLLLYGTIGALVMLTVFAVVCYFLNERFIRVGVYELDEHEYKVYSYRHRLKRICALSLVGVIIVTAVIHHMSTSLWGPYSIMEGTVFTDYESFVEYMETPVPYNRFSDSVADVTAAVEVAPPDGDVVYYDKDGNEVSKEEALRRTIEDSDGNVLCEYIALNESVCSVRYSVRDGSALPITVCTYDDLRKAESTVAVRNVIFTAVYIFEVIAAFAVYYVVGNKEII